MSQENVEIMRRFFGAFERGGLDGVLRELHPEIEWTTTGAFIEAATYRGLDEVRGYLGAMLSEFENPLVVPEEFIEAGDQAVTLWRFSGQGKQSGAAVELTLTSVSSLRDGKIVRIRNYPDKAEALEAVGLSE
jgi:ketosteroid isomerase-like protein